MSIAQVRALVSDNYQADQYAEDGDGSQKLYKLRHFPVLAASESFTVDAVAQTDPTHYSLDDNTGLITFVTAPPSGQSIGYNYQHSLISDADITLFLTLESSNVKRAAATTLDTIARNRALVEKRIKIGDLETDGVSLAAELRLSAKQLRDEDRENNDSTSFAVAEMNVGPLWRREKLEKLAEKASS